MQKGVLGLYNHRGVPFDQVVSKLQPERNPSYSPLFQVMLNWRDRDQLLSFIGLEGLVVESLLAESRTAKFDLILTLTDVGDDIWLEVEYSTDLFDEARIERMVGHLRVLLQSVVVNPGQRIGEVPLLTEAERQQLLVKWNDTRTDYPTDRCIHELFEEQVKKTPDKVALECHGQTLTYRELNSRANQLAHHLRNLGVGPEVCVGVCMERGLDVVVGLLSILKAGGAYVPLDPAYPRDHVAFMLQDSQAPVVLTQQKLTESLPFKAAKVVCVDSEWPFLGDGPDDDVVPTTTPANLAYVIYTSGSTGRPKGVKISHRGVVNTIQDVNRRFEIGPSDRVIALASLSFDLSVYDVFGLLAAGGTIVLPPAQVSARSSRMGEHYPAKRRDRLEHRPCHDGNARRLSRVGARRVLGGLRLVLLSGDWIPIRLPQRIRHLQPHARVISLGGATEASIWSIFYPIDQVEEQWKSIPYGRPLSHQAVYVLDERLQQCAVGVPGELYIGGAGVALGYWNQPELTAAKFIQDPWSSDPQARLYRTGDRGRLLPDGNIEFLGRIDQQVKIRGFRIELGGIESCLQRHPAIENVVVTVREDTPEDKRSGGLPRKKGWGDADGR